MYNLLEGNTIIIVNPVFEMSNRKTSDSKDFFEQINPVLEFIVLTMTILGQLM